MDINYGFLLFILIVRGTIYTEPFQRQTENRLSKFFNFTNTSRYIDDVLLLINPYHSESLHLINLNAVGIIADTMKEGLH